MKELQRKKQEKLDELERMQAEEIDNSQYKRIVQELEQSIRSRDY